MEARDSRNLHLVMLRVGKERHRKRGSTVKPFTLTQVKGNLHSFYKLVLNCSKNAEITNFIGQRKIRFDSNKEWKRWSPPCWIL